jgi:peptidoglycan/xylan/chitin deacetylase (PgdA/CDA1 family)
MLKVALSHDVDRTRKHYQYFSYLAKSLVKKNFNDSSYQLKSLFGKDEPYWNFPEIIRIEEDLGVKSTFFFLDESIPFRLFDKKNWQLSLGRYNIREKKIMGIMQYLDKNGWEIGVHGSYLSYNNEELLKKEKNNIEDIIGHQIIGIRQHYLNRDENTWKIHKKLGFKYDSTWGLTRGFGFKENKIAPFRPFNDDFLEIPLIIMDTPFMETENHWEKYKSVINELEKSEGILVINWHQRVFNEKEFPFYKDAYVRIIEDCISRNSRFATLSQFYKEINTKNENNH